MELTFAPRGILQVDDARISFPNFEGIEKKFNRKGERNFLWSIPDRDLSVKEMDNLLDMYKELEQSIDQHGEPIILAPNGEPIITVVDALIYLGWNVKIDEPREEGDSRYINLKVKVNFNDRGPVIWCESGRNKRRLTEKTAKKIDTMDISYIEFDLRPYDWEVNGKTGRTAYLHSMLVVQNIDRFSARFAEDEYPED